jgi:hypothetical protein
LREKGGVALYCFGDFFKCQITAADDQFVRKAQHCIASCAQISIALAVMRLLFFRLMWRAIEFDDELMCDRQEVGEVRTDRYLAPEFQIAERRAAHSTPEKCFRMRHLSTQFACERK